MCAAVVAGDGDCSGGMSLNANIPTTVFSLYFTVSENNDSSIGKDIHTLNVNHLCNWNIHDTYI